MSADLPCVEIAQAAGMVLHLKSAMDTITDTGQYSPGLELLCNANDVGLLKLVSNLKQIPRSISFFSNQLRRLCIFAHGDEGAMRARK
jgi:hypothetical protein